MGRLWLGRGALPMRLCVVLWGVAMPLSVRSAKSSLLHTVCLGLPTKLVCYNLISGVVSVLADPFPLSLGVVVLLPGRCATRDELLRRWRCSLCTMGAGWW